ncbi:uncharacterized protein LOC129002657 [Macrosteles quadrilineatus]|uniref:uncharacterized protein LOC129002657 n=1 Tax=Macrosteles quadrilineatus TaxID=74068 RepID=UPI0023E326D8|nr:uncharacterized protein LOC129002657 [Macrosteles quadrilineatus]
MDEDEVVEYETVETIENEEDYQYQDESTAPQAQENPYEEYIQGMTIGNIWDQEMTFSLIDEYRNHLQDFLYPKGLLIRDIWIAISRSMQARGYNITPAACDNKWRQLKKTYKYNVPQAGRKNKSKWLYFEALDDILGNKMIAKRIVWKQRSTIKKEIPEPGSPQSDFQEEYLPPSKKVVQVQPKWFKEFLTQYQEEEVKKRNTLQKMQDDLVALEKQKCILLEKLFKKISKAAPSPKIVEAVTLSQEMFEDEL